MFSLIFWVLMLLQPASFATHLQGSTPNLQPAYIQLQSGDTELQGSDTPVQGSALVTVGVQTLSVRTAPDTRTITVK